QFVRQTGYDQDHDLTLARTQRRVVAPQHAHVELTVQRDTTPLDGGPDRMNQDDVVDRLDQEFDSARLHRLHGDAHIMVASDEDDRYLRTVNKSLLQLETARSWKCQIDDYAARNNAARAGQEVLGRSKLFELPARGSDDLRERSAYDHVVADSKDIGCGVAECSMCDALCSDVI